VRSVNQRAAEHTRPKHAKTRSKKLLAAAFRENAAPFEE
jgi:hypothetical protein